MTNSEKSSPQDIFELKQRLSESDLSVFYRLVNRLGVVRDVVLPPPNRKKNKQKGRVKRNSLTTNEAVDIGNRAVRAVHKKLSSHFNNHIAPDLIGYVTKNIGPIENVTINNDEVSVSNMEKIEFLQSKLKEVLHTPVFIDPNIFILGYGVNIIIREYGGVSVLALEPDKQNDVSQ